MHSLSPDLTTYSENCSRSFVIVMRPRRMLFSFNTIFDVYLADIGRLTNYEYPEDASDAEKSSDPLYFGYIRLNHLWDSFRYYPSDLNMLYPQEAEELIDEIIFNAGGIRHSRKTVNLNG